MNGSAVGFVAISTDAHYGRDGRALGHEAIARTDQVRSLRASNALCSRSFEAESVLDRLLIDKVALIYVSVSNYTTKVRFKCSHAGVYRAQHDTSLALVPLCVSACSSRRAQMACACGASWAVRARAVRCARGGARQEKPAAPSSSPTVATWQGENSPKLSPHLPGGGAKLIAPFQRSNARGWTLGARLGGDLACRPVAPIEAYASWSVSTCGHGQTLGLRRCSWAGV